MARTAPALARIPRGLEIADLPEKIRTGPDLNEQLILLHKHQELIEPAVAACGKKVKGNASLRWRIADNWIKIRVSVLAGPMDAHLQEEGDKPDASNFQLLNRMRVRGVRA